MVLRTGLLVLGRNLPRGGIRILSGWRFTGPVPVRHRVCWAARPISSRSRDAIVLALDKWTDAFADLARPLAVNACTL